jgi:hypothetical protein
MRMKAQERWTQIDACFFMSGIRITLAILDISVPAKLDRNPLNANVFRSVSGFLAWGSGTGLLLFSLPFYPDEERQD